LFCQKLFQFYLYFKAGFSGLRRTSYAGRINGIYNYNVTKTNKAYSFQTCGDLCFIFFLNCLEINAYIRDIQIEFVKEKIINTLYFAIMSS